MNLKGHNSIHLLCGDSMLTSPIYLTWIWETEGFRIEINYFSYQQNTRNEKLIWTQEFLLAKHYFQGTSTLLGNSGNPELIVKACVLFCLMGMLTLWIYLSFFLCFNQLNGNDPMLSRVARLYHFILDGFTLQRYDIFHILSWKVSIILGNKRITCN